MPEEKDDLNKVEQKVEPAGDGQPEKKPITQEEIDVLLAKQKELEDRAKKAEEERENYKQGLIAAKTKKDDSLFGDDVEEEPAKVITPIIEPTDEQKTWDEIDRRSEEKANKIFSEKEKRERSINEQLAKKDFIKTHPELLNDALRQSVYNNFNPKYGTSVEGIKAGLELGYNIYKIENNIPVAGEEKKPVNMPNMPVGNGKSGAGLKQTGISESEQALKDRFYISDDSWKAWSEAIVTGKRKVPEGVKIVDGHLEII